MTVDAQDHVWVVHRGVDSLQTNEKGPALEPWASSCCFAAPQILEFDAAGTLLSNWDPKTGSGFDWPHDPAGIAVDDKGNVWVAGGLPASSLPAGRGRGPAPAAGAAPAARGGAAPAGGAAAPGRGAAPAAAPPPADAQVLKFDKTGKFVLQIGKAGKAEGSDSTTGLNKPGGVAVDSAANEVYVADGFANHRIVVFDATTGAFKRSWGAYGEKPADTDPAPYDPNAAPSQQFHTVSCVKIAKDGMVYVCDRQNDRIQVFQKDGKFVKEAFVSKTTTGDGSVWDIAFSTGSEGAVRRRRPRQEDVDARPHVARDHRQLRRRRPLPGSVLRRRQRRGGLEGERLHGRDLRRQARTEVREKVRQEQMQRRKHEGHEARTKRHDLVFEKEESLLRASS